MAGTGQATDPDPTHVGRPAPGGPLTRGERLARLRQLAGDLSPVTLAGDRRLPLLPALASLLPGGLQRGSTVAVSGSGATTLTHTLLAGPTRAGSWAAFLGGRTLGWATAVEAGVALERVVVVEVDERRRATVTASLVDAFDLVVLGDGYRPDRTEIRRLEARAREQGAVLVALEHGAPWSGSDLRLVCGPAEWSGPGAGSGRLTRRRVTVTATGRRSFERPRRVDLWLPGPAGVEIAGDESSDGAGSRRGGLAEVVAFERRQVG